LHFVDTNLLVYVRDDTEPAKRDRARHVMEVLWGHSTGRLSLQVLQEYYATVTRKLSTPLPKPLARQDIRELLDRQPLRP